jgi:hypothetical protein
MLSFTPFPSSLFLPLDHRHRRHRGRRRRHHYYHHHLLILILQHQVVGVCVLSDYCRFNLCVCVRAQEQLSPLRNPSSDTSFSFKVAGTEPNDAKPIPYPQFIPL